MTRVHADEVVVERGRVAAVPVGSVGEPVEGPVRFRWNDRWYAVVAVLEHWVEAGHWWQRAGHCGPGGGAVLGIDDGEQEVWRVEAGRGRAGRRNGADGRTGAADGPNGADGPLGTYDLRFEWGTGRWSLIRVHD